MNSTISIHGVHDYDLVCLERTIGKSAFIKFFEDALKAFVKGEQYIPDFKLRAVEQYDSTNGMSISIAVSDDVKYFICSILEHKRNTIIKAIVRRYIPDRFYEALFDYGRYKSCAVRTARSKDEERIATQIKELKEKMNRAIDTFEENALYNSDDDLNDFVFY